MFTYKAADGHTTLHGLIHFPSAFDPSKKYPVLASVYGGPAATATTERFSIAERADRVRLSRGDARLEGCARHGQADPRPDLILKLGQVEIDDMAEGVKALWNRPYVDKNRVGIFGTSYGGLRVGHGASCGIPNVFAAASASSPPTDWRNYDTIYTERYMWTPEANKDGYDAGFGDALCR